MNLLVKPKKNSQEIVSVTPESAGWRYVSFSAHQLAPGKTLSLSDNSNELCVVLLTGIVSAQTEGFDWKEIGGRMSVFEDVSPYAVYLPPRAKLTVTAKTAVELGVGGAPAKGELPVRLIEPGSIRRSVRGKGPLTLLSIAHSRHWCSIHPRIYDTKLDPAFLELLENFRRNP
jgi:5-deoxy-glucuronate isomerase